MIANYHTHTRRCGHAVGSEEEYVRCALDAGLKLLGFSDHTPYDFFDAPPRGRPMRMLPEELTDYASAVRALAQGFAGRMEIRLGVEAEYYPRYFPRLLELLRGEGVEYMILGQHFVGNEIGEPYCGRPCADDRVLARYVAQTVEAMETGLFTYFAHPDLLHFTGGDKAYETQMRLLCRAAVRTRTPLEINLLGIREGRHYPDGRFWRVAAEEGCAVILGSDAHRPGQVVDPASETAARAMAAALGLEILDTLPLRAI